MPKSKDKKKEKKEKKSKTEKSNKKVVKSIKKSDKTFDTVDAEFRKLIDSGMPIPELDNNNSIKENTMIYDKLFKCIAESEAYIIERAQEGVKVITGIYEQNKKVIKGKKKSK